jgi:amino acid adenylation domain-containing protein
MSDLSLIRLVNQTTTDYEKNLCIHHKLEHFAAASPSSIALCCNGKNLSYKELNELSNAMAHELISAGVEIENFVVICLERSFELMISIFGILKAGGVYLPIMLTYPAERKKFITSDAKPKIVITSREIAPTFDNLDGSVKIILIEDFVSNTNMNFSKPLVDVKPGNLAYMIYTSGTTGNPKGVMIEHHSVLNRIGWMQKAYPVTKDDVLIQKTAISFDVSIWELFWWSFVGARLYLLNQGDEKDPKQMINQMEQNKVSVIHFVPSMLNIFISYLQSTSDKRALQSLKYIFCSGEALNVSSVNNLYSELKSAGSEASIVNLYGPTEATVDVTYYLCKDNCSGSVPIGKPIDNTQIYIINEKNEVLPPNEKGELIICGVNLARGYLNRDSLNKEKFVTIDIFGNPTRAYKTGDVAYYNNDGEVEYIGRNDNQIKLRGFRIELGEIEGFIRAHEAVSDCSVLVQNQNESNAAIIAFFVAKAGTSTGEESIKEYLKKQLPEYMVPTRLMPLNQLPLTNNGKLDKRALLEMLEEKVEEPVVSVSSGSTEDIIHKIWCNLLNKPNLNKELNFFDLGGNSLLVVQMSILIKNELNIDIDIIDLFQYPSISALSAYISEMANVN